MMLPHLRQLTRAVQWQVHAFALGVTLALASPLLGQSCVATGH
jgi:hypothetical protein